MIYSSTIAARIAAVSTAIVATAVLTVPVQAQTPAAAAAPPAPSPAKQAIAVRKAVFTLVGNNFKPLGDVLQGRTQYDAAEVQKRAARVANLSELVSDAFPDVSNVGEPDTKAKAEIWSNRADFDKRVKDFQDHATTLVQVINRDKGPSDAFKTALTTVAGDCKGCHDNFKAK